jgi:hypothetical protein
MKLNYILSSHKFQLKEIGAMADKILIYGKDT